MGCRWTMSYPMKELVGTDIRTDRENDGMPVRQASHLTVAFEALACLHKIPHSFVCVFITLLHSLSLISERFWWSPSPSVSSLQFLVFHENKNRMNRENSQSEAAEPSRAPLLVKRTTCPDAGDGGSSSATPVLVLTTLVAVSGSYVFGSAVSICKNNLFITWV